jgi:hypothetical protein
MSQRCSCTAQEGSGLNNTGEQVNSTHNAGEKSRKPAKRGLKLLARHNAIQCTSLMSQAQLHVLTAASHASRPMGTTLWRNSTQEKGCTDHSVVSVKRESH